MINKKALLLVGLSFSLILGACNRSTTVTKEVFPSTSGTTGISETTQNNTQAVYYMTSGKMMMVKDGKVQEMSTEQTLADGSVVKTNGEVVKKDGSKMMLKNGESVTMDGRVVVESPYK